METAAVAGDSPVSDKTWAWATPSMPGHEQPWLKMGGPPSKAKYSLSTDSAPVP